MMAVKVWSALEKALGRPLAEDREPVACGERLVPSSGGDGHHVVLMGPGETWCSCKGYQYRGRCRHQPPAAAGS